MKMQNLGALAVFCICTFLAGPAGFSQVQPGWKDTNNRAITEMRNENYSEAERLFKEAQSQCLTSEDRAIVQENLDVLLEKQGKKVEVGAKKFDSGSLSPSPTTFSGSDSSPAGKAQVRAELSQLEASIKKADESGDLETLLALFKRKGDLLKLRDDGETLDYAYNMHFRAQVLKQLHRDAEADELEASGARLRDTLRRLSTSNIAAPTRTRSRLSKFEVKPLPMVHESLPRDFHDSYPSTTPAPSSRSERTFIGPHNAGNTSGFLNGNPNQ
ncbi:MAG: hypothetical protein K2X81_28025 [Candidatus Obscuribacterales bacterium]|nr:hypothetical protein [Candidatus Obscuribacterales bacterium]